MYRTSHSRDSNRIAADIKSLQGITYPMLSFLSVFRLTPSLNIPARHV